MLEKQFILIIVKPDYVVNINLCKTLQYVKNNIFCGAHFGKKYKLTALNLTIL